MLVDSSGVVRRWWREKKEMVRIYFNKILNEKWVDRLGWMIPNLS